MDNPSHNRIVFNASGCLKDWIIRDYLDGKLPMDMVRQIEMHLSACPLCSDAVEGYNELPEGADINAILDKARKGIFSREKETPVAIMPVQGKKKKGTLRILFVSMAAAVALLIGSYFVITMLLTSDHRIVEVAALEEKESSAADGQEIPDARKSAPEFFDKTAVSGEAQDVPVTLQEPAGYFSAGEDNRAGDGVSRAQSAPIPYRSNMQDELSDITLSETRYWPDKSKLDVDEDKNLERGLITDKPSRDVLHLKVAAAGAEERELTVARMESARKKIKDDVIPVGGVHAREAKQTATAVTGKKESNTGLIDFEQGDYARALPGLEEILQHDPANEQALYYTGMSYYYNKQNDKALKHLEKLTKNRNSAYYQDAKWQTAVIYREMNNKNRSRRVLQEIINESGAYRQKAQEAIDALGN